MIHEEYMNNLMSYIDSIHVLIFSCLKTGKLCIFKNLFTYETRKILRQGNHFVCINNPAYHIRHVHTAAEDREHLKINCRIKSQDQL